MAKRWGALALVLVAAACSSSSKAAVSTGAGTGGTSSLVGHGHAKQMVRADLAFVIVTPDSSGFELGGGPIDVPGALPSTADVSSSDRDRIQRDLAQLGIARADVHFDTAPLTLGDAQSTSVRVEVPVSKLPDLAQKVDTAITHVLGGKPTHGLRFAVLDCSAALTSARPAALADARRNAEKLAGAAHVHLGELRSVREGGSVTIQDSYASLVSGGAPCGRESAARSSSLGGYGNEGLVALDAKPEVELTLQLSASYALGSSSDRTLSAPGNGDRAAPADAADIVVSPGILGQFVEPPEEPPTVKPADVLAPLAALGAARGDVEVETDDEGHLSYVRVHLSISRFRSTGKEIVAAVKKVVGSSVTGGVFFTSSKCTDLIEQAREDAVRDAGRRIDRLASTAHVHVGPIVGLDEPSLSAAVGVAVDVCHPDFSQFENSDRLGSISLSLGGVAGVPFVSLDAEPRVTEHVDVSETRAITH
jgi:uncharacterized protein YggE